MKCRIVYVFLWMLTLANSKQTLENPYPYEFPSVKDEVTAERTLFPMALCQGFMLEEATIDQMQQRMSNGTWTAEQIALCYLRRLYQTDEYLK